MLSPLDKGVNKMRIWIHMFDNIVTKLGKICARTCDYEKSCLEYINSLNLYTNIGSYLIKTIWPVIEIVKELCILCSSKGFLLLLQYFEIMVTRKENKIIRAMKSFNRVYSHLFGVSYIITFAYHNEYVYYNRPILTFILMTHVINFITKSRYQIYLVHTMRLWNNLHQISSLSKDWKAK
jgi:hypothetical protein